MHTVSYNFLYRDGGQNNIGTKIRSTNKSFYEKEKKNKKQIITKKFFISKNSIFLGHDDVFGIFVRLCRWAIDFPDLSRERI